MRLSRLWLHDFRCYEAVDVAFDEGCTVITGANGQGKTSLLEAVAWVATGRSFRGVPDAALVGAGHDEAIVRAEIVDADRTMLVEAALRSVGRNRVLVNKHAVTRRRDYTDHLRVTVFSPDDLAIVKGGPARRRDYLDELLEASGPRYASVRTDFERVLRQRNALLRGGIRDAEARTTLDVLDDRLVVSGGELVRGRLRLVERLTPGIAEAYESLAGVTPGMAMRYEAEWCEGALEPARLEDVDELLRGALGALRKRETDRGVTLVGPHRDDWRLVLNGLDARSHASQGEQRTLALALRLAGHRLVASIAGTDPVLLLDDVFSELDPARSAALVVHLPATQTLLTTAGVVPPGIDADRHLTVHAGAVVT
ncbi:MAG: DNA replication/repair protein RecF [Acidimicrobiia bacterium]